jgi:hypothetical protein
MLYNLVKEKSGLEQLPSLYGAGRDKMQTLKVQDKNVWEQPYSFLEAELNKARAAELKDCNVKVGFACVY